MAQQTLDSPIPTVREALDRMTVSDLKSLLDLLPVSQRPARKAELIAAIEAHLDGENLRVLWERLDKTQRLAVAETLYSPRGLFEAGRFRAKYGALPIFRTRENPRSYHETLSPLGLFLYRDGRYGAGDFSIPVDLADRLRPFVPKPAKALLPCLDELPDCFEWIEKATPRQISFVRRDTAREALVEVGVLLRLVDLGKIAVSDKTGLPGVSALRELSAVLVGSDFYPPGTKSPLVWEEEVGPIKAYAWPLLAQGSGLAELHGKKLALTKAGRAALAKPAAETLRGIWQRWLKAKPFDEFNRVDAIKGQQGKGKRSMTAPASRRGVVAEALGQCPVGAWIKFDDFSRHTQAAGHRFEVTREPWDLYIGDANYGSLGHAGYHDWHILQKRYMACLLFEYAGTLGMIDLAYAEPWEVPGDFRDLWGTDDISFLSRYDGLLWFRLNPLGAYCLGLADGYQPEPLEAKATLAVLPSLQVKVVAGTLSTEEALFMEAWVEQEDAGLWRLDRGKILNAVENGRRAAELRDFLQARDPQGLPDPVEGFLAATGRNASALRNTGPVLLVECADTAIAELIASHTQTQSLCQRAGPKHLAVKPEAEERFRKAVNELGYGMPKG